MATSLKTTTKVVTMLETGVSRESLLTRLLSQSKEFVKILLTCLSDRLTLKSLIQNKYTPLEKELKKNQAKLFESLVTNQSPEECQESAKKIEIVEREIRQFDVMDKAPILKNLEKDKGQQIQTVQKIVDQETKHVVDVERKQLDQVKSEVQSIYEKMKLREEEGS